jgi:hypothetical protein
MKIVILFVFNFLICLVSFVDAQISNTAVIDTSGGVKIKNVTIGGYLDTYYAYDFKSVKGNTIPYFVSSNLNNELAINLGYIDFRYNTKSVRARIVPGFGTYMEANYVNENGVFKSIIEASAGVNLFKTKNIWLEVGVFGSPFTNESAISKDHFFYTRSLAPEYVPYYLAGMKLAIPMNEKWNIYFYLLNGWQQIKDQNSGKSIATQLEYRPAEKHLINWNTYVGDERSLYKPSYRYRYFSDIYWLYNISNNFSIISCLYGGIQQYLNGKNNLSSYYWWQVNTSCKWRFSDQYSMAFRVEYFNDLSNVMISNLVSGYPVKISALGLCFNKQISSNALIRLDGRFLHGQRPIYENLNQNTTILTGNLTIWF